MDLLGLGHIWIFRLCLKSCSGQLEVLEFRYTTLDPPCPIIHLRQAYVGGQAHTYKHELVTAAISEY